MSTQTMKLMSKYKKALNSVGGCPARRKVHTCMVSRPPCMDGTGMSSPPGSDTLDLRGKDGRVSNQRQTRCLDQALEEGFAARWGGLLAAKRLPQSAEETRQLAILGPDQHFEPLTQALGQGGTPPAGRDGDPYVAAAEHRRGDEIAQLRRIHDVHRDAAPPGGGRDLRVHLRILRRPDDERASLYILLAKGPRHVGDGPL